MNVVYHDGEFVVTAMRPEAWIAWREYLDDLDQADARYEADEMYEAYLKENEEWESQS